MSLLKVKRLSEKARLPYKATPGSAGMDLYACLDAPVTIEPGERAMIPTGIAIALESPAHCAFLYPRSGLAVKYGIAPANCVGVIDSDYRGEVCAVLQNYSREPFTVSDGERIAQLVIAPVEQPVIEEVEALGDTERGEGGFGSTGRI